MEYGLERFITDMIDGAKEDIVKQVKERNLEGAFIDVGYINACEFILEKLSAPTTDANIDFSKEQMEKYKNI